MPPSSLSHPASPSPRDHVLTTRHQSHSNGTHPIMSHTSPNLSQSHSSHAILSSSRVDRPGGRSHRLSKSLSRIQLDPASPSKSESDYSRVLEERLDLLRSSFNFFKESICSQLVDSSRCVAASAKFQSSFTRVGAISKCLLPILERFRLLIWYLVDRFYGRSKIERVVLN